MVKMRRERRRRFGGMLATRQQGNKAVKTGK